MKAERQTYSDRPSTSLRRNLQSHLSERTQDPVNWHIWQNATDNITNLLQYVFRSLRLVELSKHYKHKLLKLNDRLQVFGFNEEDDDDKQLDKILEYIQDLLKVDFENVKIKDKLQVDLLKQAIQDQFKKYKERTKQDKSIQDKSFSQDIQELIKQTPQNQFKESLTKPVKHQQLELTKNQIQYLYKINKISVKGSVKDSQQLLQLDKISQLEDVIYQKLDQAFTLTIQASIKLVNMNGNKVSYASSRPTSQSLHQLIKKKIFERTARSHLSPKRVELTKEFIVEGNSKIKLKNEVESYIQQQSIAKEQKITTNFLANEKMLKMKQLSKYFAKYMQSRDISRDKSSIIQKQKEINGKHFLNVSIMNLREKLKNNSSNKFIFNKTRDRPSQSPIDNSQNTNRMMRMSSKSLYEFLHQQKNNKQEYKDKIKQSKSKKVFQAVHQNSVSIIQQSGFNFLPEDYNTKDDQQNTALYYSAKNNNYELCQYLLKNGANPNIKCSEGQTPTHLAYATGNYQLMQLFIENGADLNVQDDLGMVPHEKETAFLTQGQPRIQKKVSFAKLTNSPKFQEFLEYESKQL
ncbi:hypothetical protein pb186bvf_006177 [Paramecium bursaria]